MTNATKLHIIMTMKVLDVISKSNLPVDVRFLVDRLGVNKTTVYRQIDKLLEDCVISEVNFGDGKKRYELKSLEHHHHLICRKCDKLEDVSFEEKDFLNKIKVRTNFKITDHSLEFFGYCSNCQ